MREVKNTQHFVQNLEAKAKLTCCGIFNIVLFTYGENIVLDLRQRYFCERCFFSRTGSRPKGTG